MGRMCKLHPQADTDTSPDAYICQFPPPKHCGSHHSSDCGACEPQPPRPSGRSKMAALPALQTRSGWNAWNPSHAGASWAGQPLWKAAGRPPRSATPVAPSVDCPPAPCPARLPPDWLTVTGLACVLLTRRCGIIALQNGVQKPQFAEGAALEFGALQFLSHERSSPSVGWLQGMGSDRQREVGRTSA